MGECTDAGLVRASAACALVGLSALAGLAGCRQLLGIDPPIDVAVDADKPIDALADTPAIIDARGDAPVDAVVHLDATVAAPTFITGSADDPSTIRNAALTLDGLAKQDLVVIAIGYQGSAVATSITDTFGSTFTVAVAAVTFEGLTAAMYSGEIAGSGNDSITIAFAATVTNPDVRGAAYRGVIDLAEGSMLDTGETGTGASAECSVAIDTTATDLVVAANYDLDLTTGSGAGFTEHVLSQPDEDLIEDAYDDTPGEITARAKLNGSIDWIMQAAAFKVR